MPKLEPGMAGDAAGTRHAVREETACLRGSPRPGWCRVARSQEVMAVAAEWPVAQAISHPQKSWVSTDAAGRPLCFGRRDAVLYGNHEEAGFPSLEPKLLKCEFSMCPCPVGRLLKRVGKGPGWRGVEGLASLGCRGGGFLVWNR